ncbi:MAG: hypothetical protein GTN89_00265 [Acidobacteria bacterium]|nr:hypothetical protein [Acidobacteriota bacterium]NIM60155.1 hypothetical protein [Acidobacteriota bacterium]NIO57824.1 hypothetical protein [Acidobacteriota bacterium]NIQ28833.1 hypothetical protein [Acidobacteriota bacterium]NIQ83291.1 hypothetical protein [Acidobacteriota bacterium]
MTFDQENPTHRFLMALAIAGLLTFAVWGLWMSIGFILGALGWLASTVGGWLTSASNGMTNIHANVAYVALGCGAVVGAIIGFSVRVDKLWERLSKGKSQAEETTPAS